MPEGRRDDTALLLAGHGLATHPDGAVPVFRHAETLRNLGRFADVRAGFLRQEPELSETLAELTQPRVYVVPMLASKGYISDTAMAGRLELSGPVTRRTIDGRDREIRFCDPVGTHPDIPVLLARRIENLCRGERLAPEATEIVLAGHGTPRTPESAARTRDVAARLTQAAGNIAAGVHAFLLEEDPLIDVWAEQTRAPNIVVAPFLMANWYHGSEDLPGRIGLDPDDEDLKRLVHESGIAGPYPVDGRRVWYLSPLGHEPEIAGLALAMVETFDEAHEM